MEILDLPSMSPQNILTYRLVASVSVDCRLTNLNSNYLKWKICVTLNIQMNVA